MNNEYQAWLDSGKLICIERLIGLWGLECLKGNTPMNPTTLQEWVESADTELTKGEKVAIKELLEEIE